MLMSVIPSTLLTSSKYTCRQHNHESLSNLHQGRCTQLQVGHFSAFPLSSMDLHK